MSTTEAVLVSVRALMMRYGSTTTLEDVDLDVPAGADMALTGRSGSGKTTLLLVIAGLLVPTQGTVTWPGLDGNPRVRRGQIGMVFQAPALMPELTALQNVTLPLRLRGVDRPTAERDALEALVAVAAADLRDALPTQLSGGQQQRIAIARVLAGRHRLVLADEPTGALDRAHAFEAALALRDGVAAVGGALVLATHDPELAELFDHRVAIVDGSVRHSVRTS
ncbi:ABC transporter ATP-binding protein [Pedococcus bigeumensis]|uniref:ABC transporter ATP-binding protein n=1 Tax=Pedococcus bigeumensis TaxID=433644 RepID=A0A502CWQ3_9MICO|nr:ABC transporter ATP-binding protein [Pedococcus bigeumensis]TPG17348.1 ABC transporter ATP-binding protein [Pedococcus bigeumensis]